VDVLSDFCSGVIKVGMSFCLNRPRDGSLWLRMMQDCREAVAGETALPIPTNDQITSTERNKYLRAFRI
jgi:hypothetical protein